MAAYDSPKCGKEVLSVDLMVVRSSNMELCPAGLESRHAVAMAENQPSNSIRSFDHRYAIEPLSQPAEEVNELAIFKRIVAAGTKIRMGLANPTALRIAKVPFSTLSEETFSKGRLQSKEYVILCHTLSRLEIEAYLHATTQLYESRRRKLYSWLR